MLPRRPAESSERCARAGARAHDRIRKSIGLPVIFHHPAYSPAYPTPGERSNTAPDSQANETRSVPRMPSAAHGWETISIARFTLLTFLLLVLHPWVAAGIRGGILVFMKNFVLRPRSPPPPGPSPAAGPGGGPPRPGSPRAWRSGSGSGGAPGRAVFSRAARSSSGGSKSGNPCDRLTAPQSIATRVMRRMTDSVKRATR